MEEFLTKISGSFLEFWKNLSTARKIATLVLAGVITAVMTVIITWAANTGYRVLYTDLNKEDAARIARLLEERMVAYQLSDDGKTIKVPESDVEIWRLELAKQGLSLTGTVGYEIFDNQPFGTTSFVQKINRQRALEGELVKTISYIEGVKRARVHLSIPENSPFVSEKKPPSASVVIDLDANVTLTSHEIKGIAQLVAGSVEAMRPEHVVIIDDKGKKLSDNMLDPLTAETSNILALETKFNRQLEQQVEDILSRVVGEGKVMAKVSANFDFTESVSTETTYDGEGATVLSEVNNKQKLKGVRPSPQGIPGARSNLPAETPQPGVPETRNDVDKELVTRNMNVPQKITKSKNPTAKIVNLSVAVMLDGKRINLLNENGAPILDENGIPKTKYEPWSNAQIDDFKQVVTSSIGIDLKRGDSIVVKNMEFATEDLSAIEAMMKARERRELIRNLIKYVSIGLVISLFFFFVVRPFIQWVTENTVESVEDFLPKTIEELEKIQANQKLPGLEDALPQIEEKMNPEKVEGNMLKEKIISLVEANPTKAAQVVHEMIHTVETQKEIA